LTILFYHKYASTQKKRLPSQATAFFSANIMCIDTHDFLCIDIHDFLCIYTKKAITFSGDRFESSIGISFF